MKSRPFLAILAAALALTVLGCGGGGDGDDLNLSGRWRLTANLTADPCGVATLVPELRTLTGEVTVQQSGSQLLITDDEDAQFTGMISGSTMTFSGSVTETDNGCTLTITYSGNGRASDTQVQGTLSLTLRGQPGGCANINCSLTYSFTMTRI
jgi:hypothetical protein